MHDLIIRWFNLLNDHHYYAIILLMAMESSIFPVPSEIVIPPAAFLAAQGKMSLWGVIIAGTVGSYLGSAITYWLSAWLGRAAIVRWGKFAMINAQKLERAEHFIHRYEAGGVFFARLLPVIRHLISIPAGIIRMRFGVFSLMTVVGSFIWCCILAWLGHNLAQSNPELITKPDEIMAAIKGRSVSIILIIVVFCVLYFLAVRMMRPKSAPADVA